MPPLVCHSRSNQKNPNPKFSAPARGETVIEAAQSRPGEGFLEQLADFIVFLHYIPIAVVVHLRHFPWPGPPRRRAGVCGRCQTLRGSSLQLPAAGPLRFRTARSSFGTCRSSRRSLSFLPACESEHSCSHRESTGLVFAKCLYPGVRQTPSALPAPVHGKPPWWPASPSANDQHHLPAFSHQKFPLPRFPFFHLPSSLFFLIIYF